LPKVAWLETVEQETMSGDVLVVGKQQAR